jgi:hypothetical protein
VFSRHRRVAQWLERLLDTQEVSGSTPPAPTILRSLRELRMASQLALTCVNSGWQAKTGALSTEARSAKVEAAEAGVSYQMFR